MSGLVATDPIVVTRLSTPLGAMVAAGVEAGVCLLEFWDRRALPREMRELPALLKREVVEGGALPACLLQLERELEEYFAGTRRVFEVSLVTPGSAWERAVWGALVRVPYGVTRAYGELAAELGKPGAARAVGLANGRNRIAIVVPCHRIINSSGGLHGYGGGLERKRWLLEHEGALGGRLF